MEVKEAIEKLKQIRSWYERGAIPMEMANSMGEKYVKIANKFYNNKAKEYGLKGKSIKSNVKYWPSY